MGSEGPRSTNHSVITVNQLTMINLAPRDREGGDCFIRAMAYILRGRAHYTEIEELVVREQPEYDPYRKTRTGIYSFQFLRYERRLFGKVFKHFRVALFDKVSIRNFVHNNQMGTFLVCAHQHAFVVENGQIFDARTTRWEEFVREAWIVETA
jgi:hypothetical protein